MASSIRHASYYHSTVRAGGPGEAYRPLAQGEDELGGLTGVHAKLHEAAVDVYASTGVPDGHGSFGYVRLEGPDRAAETLGN